MRLTQLDPQFLQHKDETPNTHYYVTREEANGIMFLCPLCFMKNKGGVGTHSVICWNPSVPQTVNLVPGRWNILGSGYNDLTLQAGSSSVRLGEPCKAHFFIRNGEVIMT